ncbi:MAG: short-chain dehydrogenase [Gammaproteobacteria bacterium]|nr:MAG: short-chain dehydrogenase [Gammaproteobacteria bacterium]
MSQIRRVTLITGASSGIGKAITLSLLQAGHEVIGLARDFSQFNSDNTLFHPISIDFSKLGALPEKLQAINKRFPAIDSLICCAGKGQFGSLENFSYDQIEQLMALNFTSQAFVARAFIPTLKQKERSNIIFIGSEAALAGSRKGTIYCASKFALRGFAQALRDESARSGLSVSIINPGMVKTNFFSELDFEPGEEPSNHLIPEDIAETVSLILSSRAGTVIDEINLNPQNRVVQFKNRKPKN